MTITIDFPAATEEKLRAQAAASGKKVEALVLEAVEAKLTLAQLSLREILAPLHDDFRQNGMTEQELESLAMEALSESRAAKKSKPGPRA